MSETDYQQIVERVLQTVANPTILTDTGIEAAQQVAQLAAKEEVEWALAGGLAMHFYGSPRLTKDVDFIASQDLSLTPEMVLVGGKTNTLAEFRELAREVGLKICATGRQPSGRFVVECVTRMP